MHNHTYGECWLKNQADPSRPEAGAYGAYPAAYRKKHRTAPEKVLEIGLGFGLGFGLGLGLGLGCLRWLGWLGAS